MVVDPESSNEQVQVVRSLEFAELVLLGTVLAESVEVFDAERVILLKLVHDIPESIDLRVWQPLLNQFHCDFSLVHGHARENEFVIVNDGHVQRISAHVNNWLS